MRISLRVTPRGGWLVPALLVLALLAPTAQAAAKGCAAFGQLPSVIEMDQGLQQELRLPVAITRAAVGEPKVADVQPSGHGPSLSLAAHSHELNIASLLAGLDGFLPAADRRIGQPNDVRHAQFAQQADDLRT